MSTTTVAPTISVTAEDELAVRMDPYWMAMAVHNNDIEEFDDDLELSTGEHIQWLEGCQANIERWITVLRQLDNGELAAEPWLIEAIREEVVRLDEDHPNGHECADYCREIHVATTRRSAVMTALADRLEAALVGAEVPA
jgi:hypothetical protein